MHVSNVQANIHKILSFRCCLKFLYFSLKTILKKFQHHKNYFDLIFIQVIVMYGALNLLKKLNFCLKFPSKHTTKVFLFWCLYCCSMDLTRRSGLITLLQGELMIIISLIQWRLELKILNPWSLLVIIRSWLLRKGQSLLLFLLEKDLRLWKS